MTTNLLDDQNQDPGIDETKSYLEQLVGENKKFKDAEALAKGKYLADKMVDFKNSEYDVLRSDYLKLREDYNSRAKLEEVADQMTKLLQQSNHDNTLNVKDDDSRSQDKPVFDPEQVKSLVASQYQEIELAKTQDTNFNLVKEKLQQRYGSNYKDVVKQHIDELGITEERLNRMAREEPKVLIRTLGLDQETPRESFQAPPKSNQRSDSFAPSFQKRTWAYYQNMRKNDPTLYTDPKTQLQLMQDKAALGSEFEDGDWHAIR